ncbi:hypothetical protein [Kribbella sp. NPDC051620]|uniref:hypothetical protein n=1 Tax=Kribbella sp. NPDC051620 TaxID=3364120 RepID=UPI0037AD5B1F
MQTHSRRSVLGFAAAAVAAPIVLSAGQASAAGTLTFAQYADTWTQINKARPSTSYWFDRDRAKVGLEFGGSALWRSVFRFDITALAGGVIEEAGFSIVLDHTPTPNPTPVALWTTGGIDADQPLTWNNFAGSWLGYAGTATGAAYAGAGQPDQQLIFPGLAGVVQQAVDKQERFLTLGLRAVDEANMYQWKKFLGDTARLQVTYHE